MSQYPRQPPGIRPGSQRPPPDPRSGDSLRGSGTPPERQIGDRHHRGQTAWTGAASPASPILPSAPQVHHASRPLRRVTARRAPGRRPEFDVARQGSPAGPPTSPHPASASAQDRVSGSPVAAMPPDPGGGLHWRLPTRPSWVALAARTPDLTPACSGTSTPRFRGSPSRPPSTTPPRCGRKRCPRVASHGGTRAPAVSRPGRTPEVYRHADRGSPTAPWTPDHDEEPRRRRSRRRR
jgi:hypothetical protein